jgi:hypothetical protein
MQADPMLFRRRLLTSRASLILALGLALGLALAPAACGSDDSGGDDDGGDEAIDAGGDGGADAAPDAAVVPVFSNPVDVPDDELATAVLGLLGAPIEGANESCDRCHGMTRQSLRHWRALGDQSRTGCLTDLAVAEPDAARTMIDCLRAEPADPKSAFDANRLGIYATAAHLPWFTYLFSLAYGAEGESEHQDFVEKVGMPRGDLAPFAQADFDLVAAYFERGLPLLDDILIEDPRPGDCTQGVSADVTAHVDEMALSGWRAVNSDSSMLMHGCGGAGSPRECLTDQPRVSEWEALAGSVVRSLRGVSYSSAFWTRSSADGRFVAHGVRSGADFSAAFVDLQTDQVIPAAALYDPGFFPDGSGFAFQGGSAFFCEQSVLTSGPTEVSFDEPGCASNNQVALYQHIGASLGGGDYWAVDGQFVSDDGGHSVTARDPSAFFDDGAPLRLTPMIYTGSVFEPTETVNMVSPYEGDHVISPSARLLISRVAGPESRQLGFVLRRVDATATPAGYQVETPEIARYCTNGGKPSFSFDERWLTLHHYVEPADAEELGFTGPDDPAFAAYLEQGASNVYVLDLLTGDTERVTNMAPGEYALYPHFRSDGWIYFMVRAPGPGETIAATDAALVLGGE